MNKLIAIISISLFIFSCKKKNEQINPKLTTNDTLVNNTTIDSVSNVPNDFLNKELVQITKQDGKFKLSCSKKFNKVILKAISLQIEIVESRNYAVDKIVENGANFKVYLKGEEFYYDVSIEDKNLGISYWKNCNIISNKIDTDYSFFAIDENNLKKANLEKENCDEDSEMSNWIGKYHLEVSSTHGDGKEVTDKYDINVKDLKNIEFISENYKFLIAGEFLNENAIEGDVTKIIINKKNATTSFSPFLRLSKDADTYFVKCPLITQGGGFSTTQFEIEKIK